MTEPWLDQALMDSAFKSLIDRISLYALVKESVDFILYAESISARSNQGSVMSLLSILN